MQNAHISEYDSNDRNASLKLIDWFDIKLIKKAKVLVVGTGAIGNEVLKNLALLGIGNIFVFDRDKIERSNLSRSILFRESDADAKRDKAEAAAAAIKTINPEVNPRWLTGDIRFNLGLGFINRMDVVIAGFDNIEARQKINEKCWTANRPWIEAGIDVFNGQVAVYFPGKGACYDCLENSSKAFTKTSLENKTIEDGIDLRYSCGAIASKDEEDGKVPTTPMIASIVAGVQVQEALKILAFKNWRNRNLISKKFKFDGTNVRSAIYEISEYTDCEIHENRINPRTVKKLPEISTKTTVRDFVSIIKKNFGKKSSAELNFDLVVEMKCVCGKVSPILEPLGKSFREDLRCENCGWIPIHWDPTVFRTTNKLANFDSFQHKKLFLESTLEKISIPPFEWLEIYASDLNKNLVIEISGNEKLNYEFNVINK